MSEILETVQVEGNDGPVTINKDDYDPKVHKLYEAAPKAPTVDELKATLTEAGVEIPAGAKKKDLEKLVAALPTSTD